MYALVIGNYELVTGLQLVGVKGNVVSSADEAWSIITKEIENIDVAIIIISEELSTKMKDKIDNLRLNRIVPLIVEIPGTFGASEESDMYDRVRKMIGITA